MRNLFDNRVSTKRDRISFVFQNYNNIWVIDQVLHQEKENHRVIQRVQPEINDVSDEKFHFSSGIWRTKRRKDNKINENNSQIKFTEQHSYKGSIFRK